MHPYLFYSEIPQISNKGFVSGCDYAALIDITIVDAKKSLVWNIIIYMHVGVILK